MPHPPEHKLRWYQYRLSSLFILTTLVALASGWYANEMQKATERRKAIAEIEKVGGSVKYYDASNPEIGEPPRWYSWLRRFHGDEHLGNAIYVDLDYMQMADTEPAHLPGMTTLEYVIGTQVTDAGLVNLKGLTKLRILRLGGTPITNAGLVHLKGLTKLEQLGLSGTQITDAGPVHLKGLTNLKGLYLIGTQITDAGLVHLKGLTKLEELMLQGTQVTGEGVKNLQEALPNCKIHH